MAYSIQAVVAPRGVFPDEGPAGLVIVQLNDHVQMIPLGTVAREHYGIPLLPLTDDRPAVVPQVLQKLCADLAANGALAYIEAEIFGGEGVQAHVLVDTGGRCGPIVVAHDAINAALRSLGIRPEDDADEFDALGLGKYRDTDAWVNGV